MRSDLFARWSLFVVLVPLLPIGANLVARWLDVGYADWSFTGLFGNGDLLVLGTVVAAASAGDLLFDPMRHERRRDFSEALAISIALVIAMTSALVYGLVTLKKETGGALKADRIATVQTLQVQTATATQRLNAALGAASQARDLSNAESMGVKSPRTSGVPGAGALAQFYEQRARDTLNEVGKASASLLETNAQLAAAQRAASDDTITASSQTASASVAMFSISIVVGGACIMTSTRRRREKIAPSPIPD